MSAHVFEIDLSKPLVPIRTHSRHGALWMVIRFGPRPIGWLRWRRAIIGETLTSDVLQGLIADQLGMQVMDLLRNPHLRAEPDISRHAPLMSIVICTREHPDQLERQLLSIEKLVYPRSKFETIVVDNAPRTGATRRVCDHFKHLIRYVVEPHKGLDYARNTGWKIATGDIICYTDDDATVDPYWLNAHAAPYADPNVQCVTGLTFPLELQSQAQEYFERYGGMGKGFQPRVYRPGTWNAFYPLGSGRFGAGVNMSLRRSMIEHLGGFDDALDVGSIARGGGDLDIMARSIQAGGTLIYEPLAMCWHQHRRTMKQLRQQMFDYGWGFAAYCAKHSSDLELGNYSMRMLQRWASLWGRKRLGENLKLALKMRSHFPIHLILLEIAGGVLGYKAYKRSRNKVRTNAIRDRLAKWGAPA